MAGHFFDVRQQCLVDALPSSYDIAQSRHMAKYAAGDICNVYTEWSNLEGVDMAGPACQEDCSLVERC